VCLQALARIKEAHTHALTPYLFVTSLKDDQNKGRLKLFSPLRAAAAARQSAGTPFFISLAAAARTHPRHVNNDNKTPTIKE
jgi:hypothetical protein